MKKATSNSISGIAFFLSNPTAFGLEPNKDFTFNLNGNAGQALTATALGEMRTEQGVTYLCSITLNEMAKASADNEEDARKILDESEFTNITVVVPAQVNS